MINIKELRIGNKVHFNNEVVVITAIYCVNGKESVEFEYPKENNLGIADVDDLEGIPLSEQITDDVLNALDDDFNNYELKPKITINTGISYVTYKDEKNEEVGHTPINHVHQLQNLYFALSGFSKELQV